MLAFIFDTETTGLIDNHTIALDKQPEVIDFYGAHVDLAAGKILESFETMIKPQRQISADITRITGITQEQATHNTEPFSFYANSIQDDIEGADCIIAHNLSFDKEILDLEFERLGMKLAWPRRLICTVEATVHLKGFRLTLQALHELLFGEPFKEAHRAKSDTQALIRCAIELFKRGEI